MSRWRVERLRCLGLGEGVIPHRYLQTECVTFLASIIVTETRTALLVEVRENAPYQVTEIPVTCVCGKHEMNLKTAPLVTRKIIVEY